jgi:hypothetical protein
MLKLELCDEAAIVQSDVEKKSSQLTWTHGSSSEAGQERTGFFN